MSFFGGSKEANQPAVQVQVVDHEPKSFFFNSSNEQSSQAPQTSLDLPPLPDRNSLAHLFDIGIFRDTIAPNFALHGGLAIVSWGLARATDRVAVKDIAWPVGFAMSAWWSAVGRRVMFSNVPLASAFRSLSWAERLILTGVSAWSARLAYRVASRELRRGKDDPRYEIHERKANPTGFWAKSFAAWWVPEVIAQTFISLPFTAPFHHQGQVLTGYHPVLQMLAVGLFTAGFTLEALADIQLEQHQKAQFEGGLLREGVWSIVRHPNYLGDALVHASFLLLLYGSDILAPVELLALLGPIANYAFLRYFGGERMLELSQHQRYSAHDPVKFGQLQAYKQQKNAFWPDLTVEWANPWLWAVAGAGAVGVAVEQALRHFVHLS